MRRARPSWVTWCRTDRFSAFPRVSAARLTIDEDLEDASDATAIKTVLPLACEFERTGIPGVTSTPSSRWAI
jgi:hypothetical protein